MRKMIAGLAGVILIGWTSGAYAQSLKTAKPPAELPPSSYAADYYVDSRGCAYIRAGYGGNVSWIPRVTRARRVVCGQTPTFAGRKVATEKTQVAALTPKATTVKKTNASTFWFGTPTKTRVKSRTVVKEVETKAIVKTEPVKVARVTVQATTKPRRVVQRSKHAIRTGPQAVHPADAYNGRNGRVVMVEVRPQVEPTRITVTRQRMVVPEGYESLLADSGTYGMSGVGTPEGKAAMDLIWTETMPRRLIDVTTGRDVTSVYPKVRYPETTVSTRQYAALTPAKTTRKPIKKRKTVAKKPVVTEQVVVQPKSKTKRRKPVNDDAASPLNMETIEDMSALDESSIEDLAALYDEPTPAPAGRFIQVATFGVPANAVRTSARFKAAGLPVTSRGMSRSGKKYQIVLLGPFTDSASVNQALRAARGAGFSDAFTVK